MKKILLTGLLLSLCLSSCKKRNKVLVAQQAQNVGTPSTIETRSVEKREGNQLNSEDTEEFVLEDHASFNVFDDEEKKQVETDASQDNLLWDDVSDEDQEFQTVQFEYNSSIITPSEKEKIKKNAHLLRSKLSENAKVKVKGHSCKIAKNKEYNYVLSQERAQKVAVEYEKNGISHNNLKPVGYGSSILLTDEDGMEAQSKNRRVETEIK